MQVQIYDLSGNIVVELLNDSLSSGAYKEDDAVIWDGTDSFRRVSYSWYICYKD